MCFVLLCHFFIYDGVKKSRTLLLVIEIQNTYLDLQVMQSSSYLDILMLKYKF